MNYWPEARRNEYPLFISPSEGQSAQARLTLVGTKCLFRAIKQYLNIRSLPYIIRSINRCTEPPEHLLLVQCKIQNPSNDHQQADQLPHCVGAACP